MRSTLSRNPLVERMFHWAETQGFAQSDLFLQKRQSLHLRVQGKIEDCLIFESGGMSLTCYNGRETQTFHTNNYDLTALLDQIGITQAPETPALDSPFLGNPKELLLQYERFRESFFRVTRETLSQFPQIQNVQVELKFCLNSFVMIGTKQRSGEGNIPSLGITANWITDEQLPEHHWEIHGYNPEQVLANFENSPLFVQSLKDSLQQNTPWPAPLGEIPIFWSSAVVANLFLPFLRNFEGQRVLEGRSFLTTAPAPLPFHFSLVDRPVPTAVLTDSEGTARRSRILFENGTPKGLALDRNLSEQMQVKPTGHAVRDPYDSSSKARFSHLEICGNHPNESLLAGMEWGLYVDKVRWASSPLGERRRRLTLEKIALIHHGELGEFISPVELEVDLFDLLASLKHFSHNKQTWGFDLVDDNSHSLLEISAPHALSPAFTLPGSVPPANYW